MIEDIPRSASYSSGILNEGINELLVYPWLELIEFKSPFSISVGLAI